MHHELHDSEMEGLYFLPGDGKPARLGFGI
jgi:hypothetical protein